MKKEYYVVKVKNEEYVKSYYKDDYGKYLHTTNDLYRARGLKNLDAAERLLANTIDYFNENPRPSENLGIGVLKVTVSIEEL